MRVGVVGCGSIGGTLARKLARFPAVDRISFFDVEFARAEALSSLHRRYRAVRTLKALIAGSDLVVEAASQKAAREVAPAALAAGKNVLLMSLGALCDDRFTARLRRNAARTGARIYIPSGALAGLEALASASAAEVTQVTLTTRKPPRALSGVAYLERRGIDVGSVRAPTVVFSGTARDAVRHFPANVNVAAALSLAGLGFDRTRVVIIADPKATTNRHEVVAKGAFGELRCEVSNLPFPDNPKTSYLAALSAVATVRNAALGIHFGP
jgi:aspartate dehydrogenase